MKFARTDLIARVEAEIARRNKTAAERTEKAAAEHEQHRAEHVDKYADTWKAFATRIRYRVGRGQAITDDDIPVGLRNGRGGYVRTFTDRKPNEYTADTATLETLLDLLTTATDETISTSQLEAMGFRVARLFG